MSTNHRFTFIVLLLCFVTASCAQNPAYITPSDKYHIVERGETLYAISRASGVPVDRLKLYNNLESDRIFVGQKIYLYPNPQPHSEFVTHREIPASGYHLVEKGETVYRISKYYDLEIFDIMEYNGLTTFDIQVGQKIWLEPGHVADAEPAPQAPSAPATTPSADAPVHIVARGETLFSIARGAGMKVDELKALNSLSGNTIYVGQKLRLKDGASVPGPPPAVSVPPSHGGVGLHRPTDGGTVTSRFGMRDGKPHKGIDISLPVGEAVYAVLDGKVVFSGQQRGYGNVIVLEHDNYVMTVYAHNESNLARLGDEVKRGQPIASVGNTGNSTGPHLHFEYRVRGKALNPEQVLPPLD